MFVKVHMKRRAQPDKTERLRELIHELRAATFGQPGYVSGETLWSMAHPGECLVVSKWKSLQDWQRWFERPERAQVQERIDALLGSPTQYDIYYYD